MFGASAESIPDRLLARLFVQQGNPEKALAHLGVAEPMAKSVGDVKLQADLLRTRGAAYMASGEFENAIDVYRQAMVSLRSVDDVSGEAEVYTSVGWAYQSLGEIPKALECYEDAQKLFIKVGNKDGQGRTSLGIGSLYQSMGKADKVEEQYIKALPIVSRDQYARMIASVAEILQSRNQPGVAFTRYKKALSLIQPAGDSGLQGALLAGMGRCSMALGSYGEARQDFELARAKMQEAGNQRGEAGIIASIGELNYWIAISSPTGDWKPRFSEALKDYTEALNLMRAMGDRAGEIGVLTNTGLVYDAWGKTSQALTYYLEALQKLDALQTSARIEEFRIDLADQSASLYQRAVLLEFSRHHTVEAFNLSERARARTFLDQLGNDRLDVRKHLPEDFAVREEKLRQENISLTRQLGQELAKPGPEINPERTRSLQSRLSVVRKEYEDSLSQLKLSSPEYASFLSIAPLTLQEAQRQLGPDVTLVSYFTMPQMTLAFVLSKDSFHVVKMPVTELQLSVAVATLLDFSGESEAASLKPLYKWLIVPIKAQLRTSTLAVVPYGVLHDLPFAALTPDGQHYLSDSYTIFSLPSVSVLPYVHARIKPGGNQLLVFANDKEDGLPHLRYANDEARAVASVYGAQAKLGNDATAAELRAEAGNSDIVHLIGHIDRNDRNPQFSSISMGPGSEDDGPLELNQVYGLNLKRTDLVVLSGCQSQRGKRSRGDDIASLSRAFMYAGAPSPLLPVCGMLTTKQRSSSWSRFIRTLKRD